MIRQARITDFDAVVHIRESTALEIDRLGDADYRVEIQRSGFLLPTGLSIEDFEKNLQDYIVAELEGRVAGYLRLTEEHDISPDTEAFWLRPDLKDVYYSSPHAYIYGIGVLSDVKGHGVAREMLQVAEQRVRARNIPWLFSVIVTSPVTNIASLLFHEKNGFERVALPGVTKEAGLDGFQNLVYAKSLI